jgi:hypothetical protein
MGLLTATRTESYSMLPLSSYSSDDFGLIVAYFCAFGARAEDIKPECQFDMIETVFDGLRFHTIKVIYRVQFTPVTEDV